MALAMRWRWLDNENMRCVEIANKSATGTYPLYQLVRIRLAEEEKAQHRLGFVWRGF